MPVSYNIRFPILNLLTRPQKQLRTIVDQNSGSNYHYIFHGDSRWLMIFPNMIIELARYLLQKSVRIERWNFLLKRRPPSMIQHCKHDHLKRCKRLPSDSTRTSLQVSQLEALGSRWKIIEIALWRLSCLFFFLLANFSFRFSCLAGFYLWLKAPCQKWMSKSAKLKSLL